MNGIDARREDARELLSRALADGALDDREYESRIEQVGSAGTAGEIEALTRDLAVARDNARVSRDTPPGPSAPASPDQSILTILGTRSLRGNWLRDRYATSLTLLGQTTLDLWDCALPRELTVHVVSVMGECRIVVPPDVAVVNSISPVLAEVSDHVPVSGGAKTTLRLTGFAVMSEVSIRPGKYPYSS